MTTLPDPVLRDAVREHLISEVERSGAAGYAAEPWWFNRSVWTTVGVAAVVVAFTAVILTNPMQSRVSQLGNSSPSNPATQVQSELAGAIPRVDGGEVAFTWTASRPQGDGRMVDLKDKNVELVGACKGNGSVAITVTGLKPILLKCGESTSILGPLRIVSAGGPTLPTTRAVDVTIASGNPQYLVRTVASPVND
jgi:hypothetical protein